MGKNFIGKGAEYDGNGSLPGIESRGYGPGNQIPVTERQELLRAAEPLALACCEDDDTGMTDLQNTNILPAGSGSVVNNR